MRKNSNYYFTTGNLNCLFFYYYFFYTRISGNFFIVGKPNSLRVWSFKHEFTYCCCFTFIFYCTDNLHLCFIVISGAKGPAPNSEFEHSSIPATIKKMFNLSSNFLTHRDAWAGTFEEVVGELTSPRTDCPGIYLTIAGPL